MNSQRSLKCLRCMHRDVCQRNTPKDCDHFLMDRNPELLKQTAHLAFYRAEMKKASRQVQSVANFFANAAHVMKEQIGRLDDYSYPTNRLKQILNAINVLQEKLIEEGQIIEQKSKFPPQQ